MSESNKPKPITNPELLAAIESMRQDGSQENMNKMITIMMESKFLSPVIIDPPPAVSEGDQPINLGEGSKISFNLITNADNKKFFMAFSDHEELRKWKNEPNQQTAILTFDDYAGFILKEDSNADGYVINPFGANIIFTKEQVKSLKEQKDIIEKGAVKHKINKDEPVKIGQPRVMPKELIDALAERMRKMKNISSAYFTMMQQGDIQSFLVVVDFEGDREEVFNSLAEVARPYLEGMFISFVEMNSELGANAVREITPFYKKRFSLFS